MGTDTPTQKGPWVWPPRGLYPRTTQGRDEMGMSAMSPDIAKCPWRRGDKAAPVETIVVHQALKHNAPVG